MNEAAPNREVDLGSNRKSDLPTVQAGAAVVAPWKSTPPGQFAPWMTPEQRPDYANTPFRHWVVVEGVCEHHGSVWHREAIGEAVIRRDDDPDAYQGYRRSDIAEIERRGDMDLGTGIVTFWMPWGNFPPIPSRGATTASSVGTDDRNAGGSENQ